MTLGNNYMCFKIQNNFFIAVGVSGRCGHRPLQFTISHIIKIGIVGQGLAPAVISIVFGRGLLLLIV